MVKGLLNTVNRRLSHDDAGKLLLRLAVGGLMLFHGIHKLIDGVDGISGMLAAQGLPGFIAYGVLVGEVVAARRLRLIRWERGPLRIWSISLLAHWRLRYSARGVIRWPVSRPGGKNASFVLGRKVDTVGDLQFFQSGKAFISCRLSVCLLSPGIFPEAAHCAFSGLPNRTAM